MQTANRMAWHNVLSFTRTFTYNITYHSTCSKKSSAEECIRRGRISHGIREEGAIRCVSPFPCNCTLLEELSRVAIKNQWQGEKTHGNFVAFYALQFLLSFALTPYLKSYPSWSSCLSNTFWDSASKLGEKFPSLQLFFGSDPIFSINPNFKRSLC